MSKLTSTHVNKNLIDFASLILRLFVGLSMLTHGFPKLQQLTAGGEIRFMKTLGDALELNPVMLIILAVLAVFAEFICSIFIIFGLFTRWMLIPLITTMIIVAIVIYGAHPYSVKELSVTYLTMYVIILLLGPGRFSLDKIFSKKEIRY